jgi:hypothetical protein
MEHVRAVHEKPEDCPGRYSFGCVVCNLYICAVTVAQRGRCYPSARAVC